MPSAGLDRYYIQWSRCDNGGRPVRPEAVAAGLTDRENRLQSAILRCWISQAFTGKSMHRRKLRTFQAKTGQVDQSWFVVDATDQVLGRLAVRIATVLMGKHKPTYTPHVDTGDFVIVTNAARVKLTGTKAQTMSYPRYSYYPGGYREIPLPRMVERHPERVIAEAVRRMLPKSALGRHMFKKLKVYNTEAHPHQAQQPASLAL